MSVWFWRSVFEGAGERGEEVGRAVEESFCALGYELWGSGGRVLEDGRKGGTLDGSSGFDRRCC